MIKCHLLQVNYHQNTSECYQCIKTAQTRKAPSAPGQAVAPGAPSEANPRRIGGRGEALFIPPQQIIVKGEGLND